MTATTAPRPRGRPRDPDIEARAYAAALEVYSERGWYGFSLEAVSRVAKVGQAAIYRRWSGKADLLAQAVASAELPLPVMDTGSSRDDLLRLGQHLVSLYRGPSGVVGLRLVLDARTHPELAEQFELMVSSPRSREIGKVFRRAHDRGDLAQGTPLGLAVQVMVGATLSHVLMTSVEGPRSASTDERFVTALVDQLLSGA